MPYRCVCRRGVLFRQYTSLSAVFWFCSAAYLLFGGHPRFPVSPFSHECVRPVARLSGRVTFGKSEGVARSPQRGENLSKWYRLTATAAISRRGRSSRAFMPFTSLQLSRRHTPACSAPPLAFVYPYAKKEMMFCRGGTHAWIAKYQSGEKGIITDGKNTLLRAARHAGFLVRTPRAQFCRPKRGSYLKHSGGETYKRAFRKSN